MDRRYRCKRCERGKHEILQEQATILWLTKSLLLYRFCFSTESQTTILKVAQNLVRVWSLFCDGGFQDEAVDQNGEPSALKVWDNVHVDICSYFLLYYGYYQEDATIAIN